jgi:hypothetical protein
LLDGLKFGLLPALAIGMTVCLVLEFGIRLLDRSNGPVLMIPFCASRAALVCTAVIVAQRLIPIHLSGGLAGYRGD